MKNPAATPVTKEVLVLAVAKLKLRNVFHKIPPNSNKYQVIDTSTKNPFCNDKTALQLQGKKFLVFSNILGLTYAPQLGLGVPTRRLSRCCTLTPITGGIGTPPPPTHVL